MVHSEIIVDYLVICAIVGLRTAYYAGLLMMQELLLHALDAQMAHFCLTICAVHAVSLLLRASAAMFLLKVVISVH